MRKKGRKRGRSRKKIEYKAKFNANVLFRDKTTYIFRSFFFFLKGKVFVCGKEAGTHCIL